MDPTEKSENSRKPEPEKDLVSWRAPARPFKRRNRQFYVTIIAMAAILGLILFLAEGFMPVVLIVSLVFLFYVLSTVEPEEIEYKITSKGVKIQGKLTAWEVLGRFWFSRRFDSELLILETAGLPGRMEMVVDSSSKEEVRKALSTKLVEEEVPPSTLDKVANWFANKLPGNK